MCSQGPRVNHISWETTRPQVHPSVTRLAQGKFTGTGSKTGNCISKIMNCLWHTGQTGLNRSAAVLHEPDSLISELLRNPSPKILQQGVRCKQVRGMRASEETYDPSSGARARNSPHPATDSLHGPEQVTDPARCWAPLQAFCLVSPRSIRQAQQYWLHREGLGSFKPLWNLACLSFDKSHAKHEPYVTTLCGKSGYTKVKITWRLKRNTQQLGMKHNSTSALKDTLFAQLMDVWPVVAWRLSPLAEDSLTSISSHLKCVLNGTEACHNTQSNHFPDSITALATKSSQGFH